MPECGEHNPAKEQRLTSREARIGEGSRHRPSINIVDVKGLKQVRKLFEERSVVGVEQHAVELLRKVDLGIHQPVKIALPDPDNWEFQRSNAGLRLVSSSAVMTAPGMR